MKNDFQDFVSKDSLIESNIPKDIEKNVLTIIESQMNPSQSIILLKLFAIHLLMGTLTLLFCPQFSFSLTGNDQFYLFLHQLLGHEGCMIACGVIFMTPGALVASWVLGLDEMNAIKKSIYLHIMAITSFALVAFIMIDAQVYKDIAILWVIGALLGAISGFHVVKILRRAII